MVDAWLPLFLPAVFCSLLGPAPGWGIGFEWTEEEAVMACTGLVVIVFLARTIYNHGTRRDQWEAMIVWNKERRKIKTA
jgi:hypothetical protein